MAAFTAQAVLATFTGENRIGCHHFKVFNILSLVKKGGRKVLLDKRSCSQ